MSDWKIILYAGANVPTWIQLRAEAGIVWSSQAEITELFGTSPRNVTHHILTICADEEQPRERAGSDFLQVRDEGSRGVQRSLTPYVFETHLAVNLRVSVWRAACIQRGAMIIRRARFAKNRENRE